MKEKLVFALGLFISGGTTSALVACGSVDEAESVESVSEAAMSGVQSAFAHQLTKVQAKVLRTHGAFTKLAGHESLSVDATTCTKIATQVYGVQLATPSGTVSGLSAVSCTATCHGNSCSAQGCTPDSNGGCSADVSCNGEGCTDASCSTTTSSDADLYGGILEIQAAGG